MRWPSIESLAVSASSRAILAPSLAVLALVRNEFTELAAAWAAMLSSSISMRAWISAMKPLAVSEWSLAFEAAVDAALTEFEASL